MPKLNLIDLGGVTKSLSEWCKDFNIDRKVVSTRIHTYKWPVMKALMTPAAPARTDLPAGVSRRGKRFQVTHILDRKPYYLFSSPDQAEAEKLAAAAAALRNRVGVEQFVYLYQHQRDLLREWIRNEAHIAEAAPT